MNPDSNTETKILYHLGNALAGAVPVFVVLVLFPADPAHGLDQTKFLGSAIVWSQFSRDRAVSRSEDWKPADGNPSGCRAGVGDAHSDPEVGVVADVRRRRRRRCHNRSDHSLARACQPAKRIGARLAKVPLSRHDAGALTTLGAAACLIFGFFGFAVAVPWITAVMPVSEAVQRCPGAIDPSWPAVFCNHSQPLAWKYGLIEDHPIRFALAWLQLIVGWGAFFALTVRLKRYR
jgi:hypothetical protein